MYLKNQVTGYKSLFIYSNVKYDDGSLMVTTLVYSNRAMQRKDSYSSGNRRNSFLTAPVSFFKQGKKQTETYRQSDTLTPFLKGNRIRTCIAAP